MALSGTLKDFGIADILQLIGQQQKTGILYLKNGSDEVEVAFLEGSVAFAAEKRRDKSNLLGTLLIKAEMISQEQLDEALVTQQRTLKRLGDVLVELNLIDDRERSQIARLQCTETLYRLFSWKSGTYEFKQEDVDLEKQPFQPLRAENILLEGFRRMDEWGPLRKRIPSLDCTFERSRELEAGDQDQGSIDVAAPADGDEGDGPGERHKLVYRLATPGRTAERMIDLSRLGEFETLKAIEKLMGWGYLKMVAPPKGSRRGVGGGGMGGLRTKGALLQLGITAAVLLCALVAVRMALPSIVRDGSVQVLAARAGAAGRVLAHGHLLRLENALEVYRLEHGEYPAKLSELVDGNLVGESDLTWPFRSPYHYRRMGEWFVLLPPLD